jgi:hypothetical protein
MTTKTTKSTKPKTSKKTKTASVVQTPTNPLAHITFDDLSIGHFNVLSYLDSDFFSDSTVTLSNDDYLKKSIRNRLLQVVFFTEGVISLNKDADTLNRAMLRSSLSDKDIETILNTSLNISSVQLQVQSKEELAKGDEEKLKKHLEHERRTMGTVESLIGIIEDNLGDTRVKYNRLTDEEIKELTNAGYAISSVPPHTVSIEKPLTLNLDYLDLKKFSPEDIQHLISTTMSIDSNSELTYEVKAEYFTDRVTSFFTDLEAFLDIAIAHARKSVNNNSTFVPETDPWSQMFNAL